MGLLIGSLVGFLMLTPAEEMAVRSSALGNGFLIAAIAFPLDLARNLVQNVVLHWHQQENYSWDAGHLSAECPLMAISGLFARQ